MAGVKRWCIHGVGGGPHMSPKGDWVSYRDHAREIANWDARYTALQESHSTACARIDHLTECLDEHDTRQIVKAVEGRHAIEVDGFRETITRLEGELRSMP